MFATITRVLLKDLVNAYSGASSDLNSLVPTYGKYGGPGWSGGERRSPGQTPSFDADPKDILDEAFREHDADYDQADGLQGLAKVVALIEADRKLVDRLEVIKSEGFQGLDAEGIAYLNATELVFFYKQIYLGYSGIIQLIDGNIGEIKKLFATAEITRSPIILDLNGDGIVKTISQSTGVHFDHDGNDLAEQTGWVSPEDGLLVWDRNGNGQIDSGGELFGNYSPLSDGGRAANGFIALADVDSNLDGKIDSSDAEFASLRVWKDSDSDSLVADGELLSLADAGVQSLLVAAREITIGFEADSAKGGEYYITHPIDTQGNQHLIEGQYVGTDGLSHLMEDVWFAVDPARTIERNPVEVNSTIAALPDVAGFGNVHSLRQAMARDTTGQLQALVQNYVDETEPTVRSAMLDHLIYVWAGVDGVDPASRAATQIYGNVIGDARKLATLEAFLGEGYLGTWCWGERDPNPHGPASKILLQAYAQLADYVASQLSAQTEFKSLYDSIGLVFNEQTASFDLDVGAVVSQLQSAYATDAGTGLLQMNLFASTLKYYGDFGTQVLDALKQEGDITAQGFSAFLATIGQSGSIGDAGNNTLSGGYNQNDALFGLGGNDGLYGQSGDDILDGGAGDDYLVGGDGADTYVFGRGSGRDTILNLDTDAVGTKVDTIKLGAGIATTEVALRREHVDLILSINGTTDEVRVQSYFDQGATSGYALDLIEFADGTTWNIATVKAMMNVETEGDDYLDGGLGDDTFNGRGGKDIINGYAGNDVFSGGDGDDVIDGGAGDDELIGDAGDDTLIGGGGNDVLDGGSGNDSLQGGAGNDTYRFGRDSGQDIIFENVTTAGNVDAVELAADVLPADVTLTRDASHLYLTINGTSDKLTVQNYFAGEPYKVEQVRFADGTTWTDLEARITVAAPTVGADTIYGSSVADVIEGQGGADTLYGRGGDDTLLGGDENDVLYGESGDDILDGGAGNDSLQGGVGNDSYRFGRGSGQDTVYEYDATAGTVDAVEFSADVLREQKGSGSQCFPRGHALMRLLQVA